MYIFICYLQYNVCTKYIFGHYIKVFFSCLFIYSDTYKFDFILQWIVPAVSNSLKPLNELEFPRMAERLLKLAVSI